MLFKLYGNTTIFTFDGYREVAGMKCVHGVAQIRRRNRKGTGFRNIDVETTARIEDVEIVPNVDVIES